MHARSGQETRQDSPGLGGSQAAQALPGAAVPDRAALERSVAVHRRVVDGPTRHALLRAADHADLLVLGVRHRHGA
ncbi:hypothetical protein [Streptomyces tagetis]|uniref:hypothetical protein n=1 Tax=Streptomyces tagetis TaxID=2820809 RepID=UPI0035575E74